MGKGFLSSVPAILLVGLAAAASAQTGELRVEIQQPAAYRVLTSWETSVEVEGGASIFGGVKYLDLFLVLDTSKSLQRTDPRDYRTAGAIGLVESLPAKSDIQIGVVDFDRNADLISPLTADRHAAFPTGGGAARGWIRGRAVLASLLALTTGSAAPASEPGLPPDFDRSARRLGGGSATEYWDITARFDSGDQLFSRCRGDRDRRRRSGP